MKVCSSAKAKVMVCQVPKNLVRKKWQVCQQTNAFQGVLGTGKKERRCSWAGKKNTATASNNSSPGTAEGTVLPDKRIGMC